VVPKEIKNNAYAKFDGGFGGDKVYYGKIAPLNLTFET